MTGGLKRAELVTRQIVEPERIEQITEPAQIGQWYWVDEYEEPEDEDEEKPGPWIGCVVHVGSNYVLVESPGGSEIRIHLEDEFDDYLTREHDPQGVLAGKVRHYKDKVVRLMGEVKEVTARLGVSPRVGIEHRPESDTYALVKVTSDSPDPKTYENALIKAKDVELPELFNQIKTANKKLAMWMKAELLPLKAQTEGMKGCVKLIEGRIFNVSLYAGLTEEVVQVKDGKPAGFDEKLHLMQRRLYMDEECLLDYKHGGMEFKTIGKFDRWLCKKKNLNRILPFPRCMVAMRVRRERKDRQAETLFQAFINLDLAEADESTFLYIRNGKQVYRLDCGLEFDELIFPNREEFDTSQEMLFQHRRDGVVLITRDDYEVRVKTYAEAVAADKRWKKANPLKKWIKALPKDKRLFRNMIGPWRQYSPEELRGEWGRANPHRDTWGESLKAIDPAGRWVPFNQSSVYYDEAISDIKARVDYYNRLSLIIQGLYDRSPVLHPHPPVKTWTPDGFAAAVELVYDSDRVLHAGEVPCFKTYSAKLHESLDGNSVVIGQEALWVKSVQQKEYERRSNSYHHRGYEACQVYRTWRPDGDDGPGHVARIARFQRKPGKATFRWLRERRGKCSWRDTDGDLIVSSLAVEAGGLFNVSAYKPGDYLQFFQDPRTRAQYIKWAPLLLAAEDHHAGKLEAQEPAKTVKGEPGLEGIARRINVHLKRMEKDRGVNKGKDGKGRDCSRFYNAGAVRYGRYCSVSYVSYQRSTSLTKGEAWAYLKWLDSGKSGTHRDQKREKTNQESE